MKLYFRLLSESFKFAINALTNNKLRTFLSLLGVTIGIFSIIAVLAAVDSMEKNIKDSLSDVDTNTIYLFKYSFGPSDVPRWKREQFPNVSYEEFEHINRSLPDLNKSTYTFFGGNQNLKYESNSASVQIKPGTEDYVDIEPVKIDQGRFYNASESNSGSKVIVLGYEVAQSLFGDGAAALGKQVRFYGQRFSIIGTLKKQGKGPFGTTDTAVFFPVNFLRQQYGDNSNFFTPCILLTPKEDVDIEEFKAELIQKLRNFRGVRPGEINNFFINILSGFTDMIDGIVSQMNMIGWIISGFSLLVGGFGIANIMFVSVKERTNLIGIQKALGAKRKFILFQFLFEAVILSVIGGIVGMFLVWLGATLASMALDFEFVLSFQNMLIGTSLAAFIGLLSGILPAISASKLDPVEAIRTGM